MLLAFAKWLNTSELPPSRSSIALSDLVTTKEKVEGATESTVETSQLTDAVIQASPGLGAGNATAEKSPSSIILTKILHEDMARVSNIVNNTAIQARISMGAVSIMMENPKSAVPARKPSSEMVITPAVSTRTASGTTIRWAAWAARKAAAASHRPNTPTTQCTCPKRPTSNPPLPRYRKRPTYRADESSTDFLKREKTYKRLKELDHARRRAWQEYTRQMYADYVRVQDPTNGQWHIMPALVASCPLHCLASQLQSERDERRKCIKAQPKKVPKLIQVRAPRRPGHDDGYLRNLKLKDTEEDRKMGWLSARLCVKLAGTSPGTLWIKKTPGSSSATAPISKSAVTLTERPSIPNETDPLLRYGSRISQLQNARKWLSTYVRELAVLRTTEYKVAATTRALVSRNLPIRFHSAEHQNARKTVERKFQMMAKKVKKARVWEKSLCLLIEADENVLGSMGEKVEGVGIWRRVCGKERWKEW